MLLDFNMTQNPYVKDVFLNEERLLEISSDFQSTEDQSIYKLPHKSKPRLRDALNVAII